MRNFYIRKILDDDQVKNIKEIIKISNEQELWIDGLTSVTLKKTEIKKNYELSDIELAQKINTSIMSCLDQDEQFLCFTAAKETTLNIISKTLPGGYYNPHIDLWLNGDYSTTVFLNDPEEYDGGELCLLFGNEEQKFKLDAGWAITYPTGIIHRVNRVLSGIRYVSVFWTKSLIKDEFMRFLYCEISNIQNNLLKDGKNPIHLSNCSSAENDNIFMLDNLKSQILRKYGVTVQ